MNDLSLVKAAQHFKQVDPVLSELVDRFDPFPTQSDLQSDTLLSALAKAIFYQSISIQSANAVYKRFLALYPDHRFPSADELLNTPDDILRGVGLSYPKVRYLKNVANEVLNGLPNLDDLESVSDESIIQQLTRIKGIGVWSVQMVLIFQLRRLDVLPTNDLGLRAAIRDLYGLDELPLQKAVEQIGQPWKPYRTAATWYLWQSRGPAAQELLRSWS